MWNLIKLIFNVVCDLAAALLICFGVLGLVWVLIMFVIFMHTPITDIIVLALAVVFVLWRLIRWFGF